MVTHFPNMDTIHPQDGQPPSPVGSPTIQNLVTRKAAHHHRDGHPLSQG